MRFMLILVIGLLLAACSTTPTTGPEAGPNHSNPFQTSDGGQLNQPSDPYGFSDGPSYPGSGPYAPYSGHPSQSGGRVNQMPHVVYFSFNSRQVDNRSLPVVQQQAQFLLQNRQTQVTLEGHTDERGARDYNLALGEQRANAVRDLLIRYGVSPQQIRTLSYGEEDPAVRGSTEQDYAQNRRVVFVYY